MQEGKKREKERKRGQCDREPNDGEMKRRSTESTTEESRPEPEEPSDLEEGGLDLSKAFKPISAYTQDRREMLEQCFHVLGEMKLQKMLPDELKDCSCDEIKSLCWDQLQQLSDVHLLEILEGRELSLSPDVKAFADSQQDSNVDSTSSLRENPDTEDKQGSGDDSDVLSINAEMDDSDIEGQRVPKVDEPAPIIESPAPAEPKAELQQDIERSVSQILAPTPAPMPLEPLEPTAAAQDHVRGTQPSAQQLELLELEMRARAIKALMKAGEVKKHSHA